MDRFYKEPPRYNSFVKKICLLKRKYPFLQICSIGKSYQGRRIHALFLGNMNSPTLLTAAFHAQEWLTESLLVMFCEQLCREITGGSPLVYALKNRGVIIVPCVNPDGVELVLSGGESAGEYKKFIDKISGGDLSSYNANIRGVDLNHNFNAGHSEALRLERAAGIYSPAPRRYGGKFPNSERETAALVSLCKNYRPSRAYAYHSQGEEIYYKYGKILPTGSENIARMLSLLSGYKLSDPVSIASHAGFKDYFIKEFCAPGFTIEIGRGKNPLPLSDLSPIFARLYEMMVLSLII